MDFDTLAELSADDLREMGIAAIGPRKKLVSAISSMRGVGQGKYSTADLYQVSSGRCQGPSASLDASPSHPLQRGGALALPHPSMPPHLTCWCVWPSTVTLHQGRYKLEESASMGGINNVKLAIDMKTERKVALKVAVTRLELTQLQRPPVPACREPHRRSCLSPA